MVSYAVIAINVILFLVFTYVLPNSLHSHLSISTESLFLPHSFITGALNHGDWIHLIMNMIFIWYFSRQLQNFYTNKDLIKLQAYSIIPIGILTYLYLLAFEPMAHVVGYSGVSFALLGALFPYLYKEQKISLAVQMLVIHLIFIAMNMNIAWYTHLFGFAFGYLFTAQFKIKGKGIKVKDVQNKVKKIQKDRKKNKFSVVK